MRESGRVSRKDRADVREGGERERGGDREDRPLPPLHQDDAGVSTDVPSESHRLALVGFYSFVPSLQEGGVSGVQGIAIKQGISATYWWRAEEQEEARFQLAGAVRFWEICLRPSEPTRQAPVHCK